MKIDINDVLVSDGEMFSAQYNGSFSAAEFLGQRYEFGNGVHVKADYFLSKSDIVVTGSFEGGTTVSCSKCLTEFEYTVNFKFTEYYKKSQQDSDYTYVGYSIDLTQMLQDNLILSLPSRHVCSEMCKGLCSKCGCDMNTQQCDCKQQMDETNPFYGLSELIDDEEV
ncbi:MAG: DUF177 domain-containing protein [Clostridia bacterium]|nr:DUF177 domain-containing protein [Clostridia bacterium]MBT7122691.1 DUF177 domain-containing protein [Clostridia bacterium]